VILIFLMNFRATAIIGVAIPLSIVATFMLLYFTNQTLNVFTLGGLALGVGRLVDDSIVELENIHRHLAAGQKRKQAVLLAAQEVAMPILVSTITTIVVFLPVLFMAGIARYLFLPLALTIAFALTMSFWVSRTVTPLLCYYWLKEGKAEHKPNRIAAKVIGFFDALDAAYAASCAGCSRIEPSRSWAFFSFSSAAYSSSDSSAVNSSPIPTSRSSVSSTRPHRHPCRTDRGGHRSGWRRSSRSKLAP
jgi:multidrug efflux pump subunit AcrB